LPSPARIASKTVGHPSQAHRASDPRDLQGGVDKDGHQAGDGKGAGRRHCFIPGTKSGGIAGG
jgi:hypothetical protein